MIIDTLCVCVCVKSFDKSKEKKKEKKNWNFLSLFNMPALLRTRHIDNKTLEREREKGRKKNLITAEPWKERK